MTRNSMNHPENEIVPRETFGWRQKSACRLFLYNALRRSKRCDGQEMNHQNKLE